MKTNTIIMHMGYAETSYSSYVAIGVPPDDSFNSAIEAVQSLAENYLFKFLEEGHSPNIEDLEGFIIDKALQNMDSYGENLEEFGPWDEFLYVRDLFRIPPNEIIEITVYAERVILLALTGNELDNSDHKYHNFSEEYKNSVKEYKKRNNHIFIMGSLESLLEDYRINVE